MIYGVIYSLTLFDGRTYVGQTVSEPESYFLNVYKNKKGKGRRKLYYAINKYGIDSFSFDVIDYDSSKDKLRNATIKQFSNIKMRLSRAKPVISEDGSLFFSSNNEAINSGYTKAKEVAKGKRKTSNGVVFRFATKEEIFEHTGEIL